MPSLFKNKYRISSARLPGWDYSNSGGYFVTICTKDKEHFFGRIENDDSILNDVGTIAHRCWLEIPDHYNEVTLGEFVIMPNHMHGIVILRKNYDLPPAGISVLKKDGQLKNKFMAEIAPQKGSLSAIIRSCNSAVTHLVHEQGQTFAWQTRFHDHIIRNDEEFITISNYIINNPKNWKEDKFFT